MAEKVSKPHKPVTTGAGCVSCHKPHASKQKGLLDTTAAANCAGCHAKVAEQGKKKVVHKPFAQGTCVSCHKAFRN